MIVTPVKLKRRQKQTSSLIGKRGEILLWTVIRVASSQFAPQVPYPVVIVKLDDGQKTVGQLVDWQKEDLTFGRKVVGVLRKAHNEDKEGVIHYSIKFKPV